MQTLRGNLIKTCQNYIANLHKRVPAEAFPHKSNAWSFRYTTDWSALFSLT